MGTKQGQGGMSEKDAKKAAAAKAQEATYKAAPNQLTLHDKDGNVVAVLVKKDFSSGSVGFYAGGQVRLAGLNLQLSCSAVIPGSKLL
jgi:hypothetical protein